MGAPDQEPRAGKTVSSPGKKTLRESLEKSHFLCKPWSEKSKLKKKVKEILVIKSNHGTTATGSGLGGLRDQFHLKLC